MLSHNSLVQCIYLSKSFRCHHFLILNIWKEPCSANVNFKLKEELDFFSNRCTDILCQPNNFIWFRKDYNIFYIGPYKALHHDLVKTICKLPIWWGNWSNIDSRDSFMFLKSLILKIVLHPILHQKSRGVWLAMTRYRDNFNLYFRKFFWILTSQCIIIDTL